MPLNLKGRLAHFLQQARESEPFELPLFPLNTVLFPGGRLPLKVFEPRYMELVSTCLKEKVPFGICLIKEGTEVGAPAVPEKVGCSAEIVEWDMAQLGVLNIQVLGIQRFHIEKTRTEKTGLLVAEAVHIPREPPLPLPPHHQVCATILRHIIERLGVERVQPPLDYGDAVWVGYRLAELLPLKRSVRQDMLEMNDTLTRIEILHHFLARQGLMA